MEALIAIVGCACYKRSSFPWAETKKNCQLLVVG